MNDQNTSRPPDAFCADCLSLMVEDNGEDPSRHGADEAAGSAEGRSGAPIRWRPAPPVKAKRGWVVRIERVLGDDA